MKKTTLVEEMKRNFCNKCRMNSHATQECRWLKQNVKTTTLNIAPKVCSHRGKRNHLVENCWQLQKANKAEKMMQVT